MVNDDGSVAEHGRKVERETWTVILKQCSFWMNGNLAPDVFASIAHENNLVAAIRKSFNNVYQILPTSTFRARRKSFLDPFPVSLSF